MTPPTIFVVDDDLAIRSSISWLIESVSLRVETFASAEALLERLESEPPGCVVADLRLPSLSGLDIQRELNERGSSLPLIMISAHPEIPTAVRAVRLGALDFIQKPFSDQHLLDRVREAVALNATERRYRTRLNEARICYERLTPRERDVMRAIVDGKANKQVAADLGISSRTIETHRRRIMDKMQADSLATLVRFSIMLDVGPSKDEV